MPPDILGDRDDPFRTGQGDDMDTPGQLVEFRSEGLLDQVCDTP